MVRRRRFEGTHGFRRYARFSTPGENLVFRKCFRVEKMKGAMRKYCAGRRRGLEAAVVTLIQGARFTSTAMTLLAQ